MGSKIEKEGERQKKEYLGFSLLPVFSAKRIRKGISPLREWPKKGAY